MGRLAAVALMFLALLVPGARAQPDLRVALVIGNGTYAEAGTLANPVNDAADIAAKLRQIGFTVIEGSDSASATWSARSGSFPMRSPGQARASSTMRDMGCR